MTEGYSLREVGKLLGLSRSILSRLIDAGFVSPTRGSRREYRFSWYGWASAVVLWMNMGVLTTVAH